jgi:hypothetical protein
MTRHERDQSSLVTVPVPVKKNFDAGPGGTTLLISSYDRFTEILPIDRSNDS